MKGGLTSREQRTLLVGGLLALLVLYIYGAYVIGPLLHEVKKLEDQVAASQQRLQLLETATANEAAIRQQHRQVEEAVLALKRTLPAEQQLPAVIERLSDLASQAGVKIQTIFPQRPGEEGAASSAPPKPTASAGPVVYKDVLIQIDAAAGFHQLGTFLSLVETGDDPMQVSSLKIQADPKGVKWPQVRLVIKTYFAAESAAPGAAGDKA